MGFETIVTRIIGSCFVPFESPLWDLKQVTPYFLANSAIWFESPLWDLKLEVDPVLAEKMILSLKAPYGI